MPRHLPRAVRDLAAIQGGVISRRQAIACGLRAPIIDGLVQDQRWRAMQRGVFATFTGEPGREARLWAAVLRAGPGAALSHQTAAELARLIDEPLSVVHLTIPANRRVEPIRGLVIHRSGRIEQATHPVLRPPRTRVEETVLDLAEESDAFERAFSWAAAACQRGLTTAELITAAMDKRTRLRWRTDLAEALREVRDGAQTPLEFRYVRGVERPHGLPKARRQARDQRDGQSMYLDNFYDEYELVVELDGAIAHPDRRRWADKRRDNANLADGRGTLRYGWLDCTSWRCQTALQVGTVLLRRGWPGPLRACSPGCPVGARQRPNAA